MKPNRLRLGRYTTVIVFGAIIAIPPVLPALGLAHVGAGDRAVSSRLLPSTPVWDNFVKAMDYLEPRTILNTFVFVLGVLVIQLAICLPAGFALSKIPFRGAAIVRRGVVVSHVHAHQPAADPTYVVTFKLGLGRVFLGMILPVAGQASLGVLLFRQFFATLPPGLIGRRTHRRRQLVPDLHPHLAAARETDHRLVFGGHLPHRMEHVHLAAAGRARRGYEGVDARAGAPRKRSVCLHPAICDVRRSGDRHAPRTGRLRRVPEMVHEGRRGIGARVDRERAAYHRAGDSSRGTFGSEPSRGDELIDPRRHRSTAPSLPAVLVD